MSTGLLSQLETYFSDLDADQGPVTVDHVADLINKVRELPVAPLPIRRSPRLWIVAVAAAVVFLVLGAIPLFFSGPGTETPPASELTTVTTVPADVSRTTEATDVSTTVAVTPETTIPVVPVPPSAVGETWQLVGVGEGFGEGTWIGGVTDTERTGVIAVGRDQAPWPIETAVWYSDDLEEWTRSPWSDTGLMQSVAAVDGTIVAVGFDYVGDWLEDRQVVWVSDDGPSSWERIDTDGDVFSAGWIWRVAPSGSGFIAAGRTCVGPITDTEQQEAGLLADCNLQSMTVWSSTDGHTWKRMWMDEASDNGAGIYDIEVLDTGFVIGGAWNESGRSAASAAVVWLSDDGLEWSRVLVDDQPIEPENVQLVVSGVAQGGPGFVAVGWESDAINMERLARVWVSPDGVSWERVEGLPDPDEVRLWSLTVSEDRFVAVGSVRTGGEPSDVTAVAWWSEDGIVWSSVDIGDDGSMLAAAALQWGVPARSGVVAVGTGPAGESGAIWVSPSLQ